jgi:hypothetical protein
MGRRNKKSGSKTPSPAVSANASPALPPVPEPVVEPPALDIATTEPNTETVKPCLSPIQEHATRPLPPLPEDISGSTIEEPGLVRRILNWIPYFRS